SQYSQADEMAMAAAAGFQAARLRISFGGLERTTFAAERSPLPLLAALLARNGKPLLAWQRLEENLARGLLDELGARQRLAREERDRLTSLLGRLQKLDERIAALLGMKEQTDARRKQIDDLRKERDGLQLELTQFQAALEKKYGPAAGEVYDLTRIQGQLPADAALVTWLDLKALPKAADPNGEHWGCVVRNSGEPVWV